MNMNVPRKEPIQRYSQKPLRIGTGAEATICIMDMTFLSHAP